MQRLASVTIVLLAAAGLSACGRIQARTPTPVAMSVPPPPPRVAIPVSLPEPEAEPEPPTPAPTSAVAAPPPTDRPPARSSDRPVAAPVEATPAAPAPVLQTTMNVGALEARAEGLLAEAEGNLSRVNRRDLGAQARAQYDRAMSFIRNARNAIRIKNFNYAEQLASKAAAVARELVRG